MKKKTDLSRIFKNYCSTKTTSFCTALLCNKISKVRNSQKNSQSFLTFNILLQIKTEPTVMQSFFKNVKYFVVRLLYVVCLDMNLCKV